MRAGGCSQPDGWGYCDDCLILPRPVGVSTTQRNHFAYFRTIAKRMALAHTLTMKRTTIWLTAEQSKKLAIFANSKGIKVAQLIRIYIAAGLAQEVK